MSKHLFPRGSYKSSKRAGGRLQPTIITAVAAALWRLLELQGPMVPIGNGHQILLSTPPDLRKCLTPFVSALLKCCEWAAIRRKHQWRGSRGEAVFLGGRGDESPQMMEQCTGSHLSPPPKSVLAQG
eukprot:6475598-Amphidinium_carterae.5